MLLYITIGIVAMITFAIFSIILILWIKNRKFLQITSNLPSPNYSIIRIGFIALFDFMKTWDARATFHNVPHAVAKRFVKEGLHAIRIWPLQKCLIWIQCPDAYRDIFEDENNIDKNFGYIFLDKLFGKRNLIRSDGKEALRDRPVIDKNWTRDHHEALIQDICQKVNIFISKIQKTPDHKICNMEWVLNTSMTHIIMDASLGIKMDENDPNLHNYVEAQKKYISNTPWMFLTMFCPALWNYTLGLCTLLKVNRSRRFVLARVDDRIEKIRKRDPEIEKNICMADSMIESHIADEKTFSTDAIRNHVINFFVTTTTAVPPTLNCILFHLASNPDKQKKLQYELDSNFDRNADIDTQITLDSISKCKYLLAVVNEGLRIWPISASIGRHISVETKINGYTVPAGCDVMFDFTSLFKHPDAFPYRPTDFIPERFIEGGEGWDANRHTYAFKPFASGLRNCLGKYVVPQICHIYLIKLMLNYTVSTDMTADRIVFYEDAVVHIKTPIDYTFTQRE